MAKNTGKHVKKPSKFVKAKRGNTSNNQFQSPARCVPINDRDIYQGIQKVQFLESNEILSQIALLTQAAIPRLTKHDINIAG